MGTGMLTIGPIISYSLPTVIFRLSNLRGEVLETSRVADNIFIVVLVSHPAGG
jgi:hypothetical protein